MVRFIMRLNMTAKEYVEKIYIPIWLDLLCFINLTITTLYVYLHSNMVRFIIMVILACPRVIPVFTFQYG